MLSSLRLILAAVTMAVLVACSGSPLADVLPGYWTVQNPDAGESLETPDDRIMVAGSYDFQPSGQVKITLKSRDKDSKEYSEALDGAWKILDSQNVEITVNFPAGAYVEIFEKSGEREMSRKSTTISRRIWEKKVVLKKV